MCNASALRENIISYLQAWNPATLEYDDYFIEEVLPDDKLDDRLYVTLSYDRPRKYSTNSLLTDTLKTMCILDRESKVFIVRPSDGQVLGMKRSE